MRSETRASWLLKHNDFLIFYFYTCRPTTSLAPLRPVLSRLVLLSFSWHGSLRAQILPFPSLISFFGSQHRSAHTKRPPCYGGKQPGPGVNYLLSVLALLLTKRLWIHQFTTPHLSFSFYKLRINNAFLGRNAMKIKFIDCLIHSFTIYCFSDTCQELY